MDSWVFLSCFGVQPDTTLLYCLSCSIFGRWEIFQLAPLFLRHIPTDVGCCCCCCLFLPQHFLTSGHKQDDPGSSCIFPGLVLESAISEELCLLSFENGTRNQKLVPGMFILCWGTAPRPSQQTEQGNTCVYANGCIRISIFNYLYLY